MISKTDFQNTDVILANLHTVSLVTVESCPCQLEGLFQKVQVQLKFFVLFGFCIPSLLLLFFLSSHPQIDGQKYILSKENTKL